MIVIENVALRRCLLVSVMLASLLAGREASAHRETPPFISFWGPFAPSTASCQRHLGMANRRCASAVLRAVEGCMEETLRGRTCDAVALDVEIQAITQWAGASASQRCVATDAEPLYFLTVSEMLTDLRIACSKVSQAAIATAYAPANGEDAVDAARRDCILTVSAHTSRYLNKLAHLQGRVVDRIATHDLPPSAVNALVNRARVQVARIRSRIASRLELRCREFTEYYGATPLDYLLQLELHAGCVTGAAYIQSAFTCPRGFFPPTVGAQ